MVSPSQIEMFDPKKDEWDSWSRRFDQWLSISPYATGENADTKKRAAFCTSIGSETFKLLCTLCAPAKPEECTYETLKTKLNSQFGVKKLVLAERYRFYVYKQQDKQSLSEYLAELRRLASTCQWSEEYLADNLRDKFVMGLRNERLLQQLLTQDHTKSLDDLFQLAITFEAAERETVQRSQTSVAEGIDSAVSAVKPPRPQKRKQQSGLPRKQQTRNQQIHKCASCGGDHARKTCKFNNVKCHRCGKMGHIA